MEKHRRYSRKRSQRRNRRASRKMRGGEKLTRQEFEQHVMDIINQDANINEAFKNTLTDDDIERLFRRYSGYNDINRIDNELRTVFGTLISMPEEDRPQTISDLLDLLEEDADTSFEFSEYENDGNTSTISSIEGNTETDGSFDSVDDSFQLGGKRRTLAKKNKRKTNKRKTKKSKKTRKNRKRRQYGGNMTVTEDLDLQNYKDDEYNQMKNLGLYPKQ
jgi:hypothetical protein